MPSMQTCLHITRRMFDPVHLSYIGCFDSNVNNSVHDFVDDLFRYVINRDKGDLYVVIEFTIYQVTYAPVLRCRLSQSVPSEEGFKSEC